MSDSKISEIDCQSQTVVEYEMEKEKVRPSIENNEENSNHRGDYGTEDTDLAQTVARKEKAECDGCEGYEHHFDRDVGCSVTQQDLRGRVIG